MENEKIKIHEIQEKALTLPDQVKEIHVVDEETLSQANEFVKGCRSMIQKISGLMDPIIKRFTEGHRDTLADKRELEDPWIQAKDLVTPQIISYRRKIEEAKRAAELVAQREIEEKKRKEEELLKQAAELENKGKIEEADEIMEKAEAEAEKIPDAVQNLSKIPEPQAIRGVSTRKIWKWRLKNIKEVPRSHLILDEKKLNHEARNYREGETAEVPGIEFYWV